MSNATPVPEHLAARMPQHQQPASHEQPLEAPETGGGEALVAFAYALNAVENIAKTQTADTGKYSYRYADLGDVLDECKRACQMFDLAITQNPSMNVDGHLTVATTLIHHRTGQWLTFPPLMMTMPRDAQAVGSALTYMRRYALLTIFGIAPEDDDGRAATQSSRTEQQTDGMRSEAERLFVDEMRRMPDDDARQMRADFKTTFGMGLSDLPVSKHGDALSWLRQWTPPVAETGSAPDSAAAAPEPATGAAAQDQLAPDASNDAETTAQEALAPEYGAS